MKEFAKRSLSMLLALVMCFGLITIATPMEAEAASYTYNWGTREDVADKDDFTRSTAEEWYAKYSTSYEKLSALSGSSSQSSVPSSALYKELQRLMKTAHTHTTSYNETKEEYRYTDCQNGGGKISSFYSGTAIGPGWGEGGSWNREHTWPNSKGLGGQDENDIMMLRPTSTSENSSRGNTAYGEKYYHPNSESGGKYDLRGDCARICLYVYVRWGNTNYMWGASGVMESRDVLLKWMEEDPVDTWELGRNDAVQSITGTRNVFVDYPELCFLMFGEDVPAGYTTPSGAGTTPAYTITAVSSNTAHGTVSLSGKTITATPKTGYSVSGYTVTKGSATVTRSGNTFTVNAASDCTVQINFAAKTPATVTFMENGILAKTMNSYVGDSIVLPLNTNTPAYGYTFLGWSNSLVNDTTTKPSYSTSGTIVTATTKTYHAVFSYLIGSVTYYTTSTYTCPHEDLSNVEKEPATCTESGYTAGVYCNDCGRYIEGHTVIAALGHSYTTVVTPPTTYDQGYTTYTCARCDYSYVSNYTDALGEVYTVSFSVPVDVNYIKPMQCGKNGITLPTAADSQGCTFVGWTTSAVEETDIEPTVYTGQYTATADITLYALYSYTVGGSGKTGYNLINSSDLQAGDVVVITNAKGSTIYALPNGDISKNPKPEILTASNGQLESTITDSLLWIVGGAEGAWTFTPYTNAASKLFCNNANAGVGVGTGSNNTFSINGDYLYNTGTKRYLGVYTTNPDWRCYTSNTVNIGGQVLGIYLQGEAGTTYYVTLGCPHDTTDILPGKAATCTETGLTEGLLCEDCAEILIKQETIPALGHSYADGVCGKCGAADPDYVSPKFDIDVARMILGNALEFQFGVAKTKIPDTTGYYAIVEKTWADGTTTEKIVPAEQWGDAGAYHAVIYDGLAAKEMGDTFFVTIYNAEGQAVSNAKQDSVRDYVARTYKTQSETGKTMMVDMLNYGAAAQVHFSYNTGDLANKNLTDEQKASATVATPEMNNNVVNGTNYQASRFILSSRIQVQVGFKGLKEGMYAIYTYTNNNDEVKEIRVEYADFVASGSSKIGVELSALVYADARALVDIVVYNADGSVYATASDSIESACARNTTSDDDVFVALMKFADSARKHLYKK